MGLDGIGWDGIYLRQLGTLEHLAVLKTQKTVIMFTGLQHGSIALETTFHRGKDVKTK